MGRNPPTTEWGAARAQLIDAAHEMLVEHFSAQRSRGEAIAAALAFLEPAEVAARAGVARSAFHHHWGRPADGVDDGLTAFQRFVGEMFGTEWGDPIDADTIRVAAAHGGSFTDLVHDMTEVELHRYDGPQAWAEWSASVAIAIYGGSTAANLDEVFDEMVDTYDLLLERFGLRVRSPLTTRDVVSSVVAVFDGVFLQKAYGAEIGTRRVEWSNPQSGTTGPWSVATIAIHSIIEAMTEPAPDDG